jgi:hypothetical protein
MKRFNTIFALLAVLLGSACEQQQRDKYTLRGRILESCDNPEPVEGVQVGLQLDKPVTMFNQGGAEYLDRVWTGPNGEFVLSYDEKIYNNIYINRLRDQGQSPSLLLTAIPHNRDLEVGDLYYNAPKADVSFTISTPYPFSDQDTLVLGGILSHIDVTPTEPRYLVGPFRDGQEVVYRKDVGGYAQTYFPDSTVFTNHSTLITSNQILWSPYYFKGQSESRGVPMLINSCQEQEMKIRLDSSMLDD